MKLIVKKFLKILLVCILSTIIIYLGFTITTFYKWCIENQIFVDSDRLLIELNSSKVQELGDKIGSFQKMLEDSLEEAKKEENRQYHSIAEYYDPLGYSVWANMSLEIREIVTKHCIISILSGVAISIAYAIITSKKINYIFKIVIGYFGVMLIIPPIYMYSWTYRFWDIFTTYSRMPNYFYIGYTAIFILMYIMNYRIGVKIARELNQSIIENKS